jgi:hypothetical protein
MRDMSTSGFPSDTGHTELIYLILWKLRTLTDEEKKLWFGQWVEIQRRVPKGLRVLADTNLAFGTEYTGFTVLEGPLDLFEQFATIMDENATHVVEKTWTIIGVKGPMASISEIRKVLESRPID